MSRTAFHRTNIKLQFSYCKLNGFKSFWLNSKKTILPFRIVTKKYSLKYWINYTRELGKSFDDSTKLQGIFVQLIEFYITNTWNTLVISKLYDVQAYIYLF